MLDSAGLDGLIARYLKDRDEGAIEELVRRTRPRLLAAARRIGKPQDAEDAVHAAYLSLLLKTELEAPVLPWLMRAVVRIAYRNKAKSRRLREVAEKLQRPAEQPGPADTAIRTEEIVVLRRRMADLPALYRDPMVLHYLEGLPTADVALLLDVGRDAVKKRLERARKLLRGGGPVRLRAHAWLALSWGGTVMKKKTVLTGTLVVLLLGGVATWRSVGRDSVEPGNRAQRGERTASSTEAAPAPTVPEAEQEELAAGARVTGRVVDAQGRGVGGVQVIADPWTMEGSIDPSSVKAPASTVRSEADGSFVLPVSDAPGFNVSAYGSTGHGELATVRAGDNIELTLRPWRSFFGQVKDTDGKVVSGARVRWMGLKGGTAIERKTVSGEDGSYRLERVPHAGVNQRWIEVRADGYAPLFFAQGAHPSRRENRLDLIVLRGITLRGIVVDGVTQKPLPLVRVVLWSNEGTGVVHNRRGGVRIRNPFTPRALGDTRADEQGRFTFTHLPVQGFHPMDMHRGLGAAGAFVEGYICAPAQVNVGDTALKIVCWPAAEVAGRVVDPDGKPLANVMVFAFNAGRKLAWRPALYRKLGSHSVRTGTDGRFLLPRVAAGENAIHARPAWWPSMFSRDNSVKIIARAGLRVTTPDIVVKPLEHDHIDVEVVDEKNQPVWNARASYAHIGFARSTDQHGRVRLYDHARHGSSGAPHYLYVRADGRVAHAQPVDPKVEDRIRVELRPGRSVSGKVVYADGSPVKGASVWATPLGASLEKGAYLPHPYRDGGPALLWYSHARTGPKGTFALDSAPRRCELQVGAAGRWTRAEARDGVTVVVESPPPEPPVGDVNGTVRDATTGKPVLRVDASCVQGQTSLPGKMPGPGKFRVVGLKKGEWLLQVRAKGYIPFRKNVQAGATLDITLRRAPTLHGRIGGTARLDLDNVRLYFCNEYGEYSGSTAIGKDGTYELKGILPGGWRPILLDKKYKLVPGVAAGGHPVAKLTDGDASFNFDLVDGGSLEVSIQSKTPRLYREARFTIHDENQHVVVQAEGRMAMAGRTWPLEPGEYKVTLKTKDGEWTHKVTVRVAETAKTGFQAP